MKRLAGALGLACVALLGCTSCPVPILMASALGAEVTLDAATPQTTYNLHVHAPEQTCGCRWCESPPTLSLTLSAQVQWSSPAGAGTAPVVRFALAPAFVPSATDTLDPALPLDVVLTAAAPSSEPVLQATHLCPDDDVCDLEYHLTVSRVEAAPAGAVTVTPSVDGSFPSNPDGSLGMVLSQ